MKTFDSISLKRPSLKGFNALQKCAYELTGQMCYLGNEMYLEETKKGTIYFNLIYNFWYLKKEVQSLIKKGYVCRFSFSGLNGEKIPFIYNRLIF